MTGQSTLALRDVLDALSHYADDTEVITFQSEDQAGWRTTIVLRVPKHPAWESHGAKTDLNEEGIARALEARAEAAAAVTEDGLRVLINAYLGGARDERKTR